MYKDILYCHHRQLTVSRSQAFNILYFRASYHVKNFSNTTVNHWDIFLNKTPPSLTLVLYFVTNPT